MSKIRIVSWGTYDTRQPRINILLNGLRQDSDVELRVINHDPWKAIADKSQIKGPLHLLWIGLKLCVQYIGLLLRYIAAPKHDYVLLSYPGVLDMWLIWLIAKLKRAKIVWDIFVPLYDCVVNDRKVVKKKSLGAKLIYFFEKVALKMADIKFLDTTAHASYIQAQYKLKPNSIKRVLVGAEDEFQSKAEQQESQENFTVLFWGKFIPLQGIETIVEAARRLEEHTNIKFILIGRGQEQKRIDSIIEQNQSKNIERIEWVQYPNLINHISRADVCLGIFGESEKAKKVIANKVFQALAMGKPTITAQSSGLEDLPLSENLFLVPPGNPKALAQKILEIKDKQAAPAQGLRIDAEYVANQFKEMLQI